jgi:hypothetical protein
MVGARPDFSGIAPPPARFGDDPHFWLERAEDVRTLANLMALPATKAALRRIAAAYERLAKLAETRSSQRRL